MNAPDEQDARVIHLRILYAKLLIKVGHLVQARDQISVKVLA